MLGDRFARGGDRRLAAPDEKGDLSLDRAAPAQDFQNFRNRASQEFFVQLGEFSGDHRRAVAKNRQCVFERAHDAVRRLIEDQRRGFVLERLEGFEPLCPLGGQKTAEAKGFGRQARGGECGLDRDGTGQRNDIDSGGDGLLYDSKSRIGNTRHACVGDNRDRLASPGAVDKLAGAFGLVVFVITHERLLDFEVLEKLARMPGVLTGDHIRLAKRSQRSQSNILKVAKRRRHKADFSSHTPR